MTDRILSIWFSVVATIMAVFGLFFTFFGFTLFPESILPKASILPWVSSIYGAVMIGWGVTLFLVGRMAFGRKDKPLLRILAVGLGIWLSIEAVSSAVFGVYFNVGVDIAVLALFCIPIFLNSAFKKK